MAQRGTVLIAVGVAVLIGGLGISALAASDTGSTASPTPVGTTTPTTPSVSGTPTVSGTPSVSGTSTASGTPTATPTPEPGAGRPGMLIGVQGSGSYTTGGYVEYVVNGQTKWRYGAADTYFDVSPLPNGRVVAAFMTEEEENCGQYATPCARTGFVVLDPSGGEVTVEQRFSFPVRTSTNSEVHDVERLPDGGFLLTDMDKERVMIVRDGEIVWQWRASSFYEAPPDPTQRDWLHINDVDRIGDGRYLVSVRNANQLLIIDRRDTGGVVVGVVNRDRTTSNDDNCRNGRRLYDADGDGDVRCGDPDLFNKQHNPQWLAPGAVLVADSENDRIVEVHRRNGVWRKAWVLTGAGDRAFEWPRDADRLPNGNTLVTDSRGRRVVVVTESGELVRSYSTGNGIVYEADPRSGEPVGGPQYGNPVTPTPTPTGTDNVTATPTPVPSVTPSTELSATPTVVVVRPEGSGELPVLGEAATLARAALPWLPLWIEGPQVGVVFLSLALVGAGGVLRVRAVLGD